MQNKLKNLRNKIIKINILKKNNNIIKMYNLFKKTMN